MFPFLIPGSGLHFLGHDWLRSKGRFSSSSRCQGPKSRSYSSDICFEFSQLEMFRNTWSVQHIEVGSRQWIWISLVSRVGRLTPLFVCLSKYEEIALGDISSPLFSSFFVFQGPAAFIPFPVLFFSLTVHSVFIFSPPHSFVSLFLKWILPFFPYFLLPYIICP